MNNNKYYLYNGQYYWTMSPWALDTNAAPCVAAVNLNGAIVDPSTAWSEDIRPVINLKADVKITGNGTQNSPYEVS